LKIKHLQLILTSIFEHFKTKTYKLRATIMRTLSLLSILFLLTGWIVLSRYAYVCVILGACDQPPSDTTDLTTEIRPTTLSVRYNNTVILKDYEEFSFTEGAVLPETHLDNDRFLDDLGTYLINNPQRQMKINGRFRPSELELSSGIYENIGLARANAIRQKLINRGIEEDRIALDYEQGNNEILDRPISFELSSDSEESETYNRVLFTFEDMTFSNANFAIDSEVFRPSPQFLMYTDSLQIFLSENKKYTIQITGHTDNDGNDLYNEDLGLKRANSAKVFLKEMGIKNKIITSSKGETQPAAPNDKEANKQKNRRVNFLLKK